MDGPYEVLMTIIRSVSVPGDVPGPVGVSASPSEADPLQVQAAEVFADELAARRIPPMRALRARLHVGQLRAPLACPSAA